MALSTVDGNGMTEVAGVGERKAHLDQGERKRLEGVQGVVFNVQRYSLHDGPGVRTNVFLKGCPLNCWWCANPESQVGQPQLALHEHQCIQCGQFDTPCPVGWSVRAPEDWSVEQREAYAARAAVCPSGAMHWIGERRSAGEVMQEVLRDVPFYADGGGMTLTGGEPTMQPQMAEALLRLAQSEGISTAMETCGHTSWSVLEHLLPYLDLVLYDLKHMDSVVHHRFTGVGNEKILSNLRQLVTRSTPVEIRVPLIPGFNATKADVAEIAEFVRELNGAIRAVALLPYHTLGRAKYPALAREYPWADAERLTEDQVAAFVRIVESYALTVNVGG
jgi:pyruvate formate lyase activating enzyme